VEELAEEEAGVHVGVHDSVVLLIRRLHVSGLGGWGLGQKSAWKALLLFFITLKPRVE